MTHRLHRPRRFYGIDATVRDPSGNLWRIVQPLEVDLDASNPERRSC